MSTAVVVGGGLAGIVSALLLKNTFTSVYLIEQASHLGGLLKSYQNDLGLSFDYGSHFLRDTGIKELDTILYGDSISDTLRVLGNLKGGSYHASQYNPNTAALDASTLPEHLYHKGMVQLLEACHTPAHYDTLDEQLRNVYGRVFTDHLFTPILQHKYYGCDLDDLKADSHLLFGLSRIIGLNPAATRELKMSPIFDSKLSFHFSSEGVSDVNNYYPRTGGVGTWITLLESKLSKLGVILLLDTSVATIHHSDHRVRSVLLSNRDQVECDHLVWTLPPFLCIQASRLELNTHTGPTSTLVTSLYHFTFDQPLLTDVFWIQCHEPTFSTFRITLYPNFQSHVTSAYHLTAEVLSTTVPHLETMAHTVYKELVTMKVVSAAARVLDQKTDLIKGGFPFPTHQFASNSESQLNFVKHSLRNATFVGRASGSHFLMNDVLTDTFNTLSSLHFDI